MTNLFQVAEEDKLKQQEGFRRLKRVVIQNFRNIDYKEYNLNGDSLLLSGKNGLGKTNVIEAIFWTLSGYTFDGTGKTDSQGVMPYEAEKDTTVSVKLDFDYNGFSFERVVEQKWSRDKETYKGTETKLFVNGAVSKNQDTALSALQNYLGFNKASNEFNVVPELSKLNLFQLIYNANSLKTLDYKIIREIIINMVGEVDFKEIINQNQEKYKALVKPLQNHGLDLNALKTKTKKNITDKKDGLETRIDRLKSTIKEYEKDSAKVVSKEDVELAKIEIEKLDKEIETLKKSKSATNEDKLKDINSKITEFENKIYKRKTELREEHDKAIAELEKNSKKKDLDLKQDSLKDNQDKISVINRKIADKEILRDRTQSTLTNKENELETAKDTLEQYKEKRSETLKITDKFENDDMICPTCNTKFDITEINEKGLEQKQKIDGLKEGIESLEDDIEALNKAILELQTERNQVDKNVDKLEQEIKELKEQINLETNDKPVLDYLTDKVILDYEKEIKALNDSKNSLSNNVQEENDKVNSKIQELWEKKQPYKDTLNAEITARSYQENAKEKRKELKKLQDELMTENEISILIKELEKEMYEKLDKRIENTFGDNVQFKLWKLNVSNGEYDTRMCDIYVKDYKGRFIDMKRINTGMFPIRAAEIISKIKEHYNIPKSFIFIDEMSSLDNEHINALKDFDEQILATKVSSDLKTIEERKF